MIELKPCPFCGGEGGFESEFENGTSFDFVVCENCFARTEGFISNSKGVKLASKEWNIREPQNQWVSVDDYQVDDSHLVYAYCNDIVNGWVEILKIDCNGNFYFPHGTEYPAIVTKVMPITLPTPPKGDSNEN